MASPMPLAPPVTNADGARPTAPPGSFAPEELIEREDTTDSQLAAAGRVRDTLATCRRGGSADAKGLGPAEGTPSGTLGRTFVPKWRNW